MTVSISPAMQKLLGTTLQGYVLAKPEHKETRLLYMLRTGDYSKRERAHIRAEYKRLTGQFPRREIRADASPRQQENRALGALKWRLGVFSQASSLAYEISRNWPESLRKEAEFTSLQSLLFQIGTNHKLLVSILDALAERKKKEFQDGKSGHPI